LKRDPAGSAMPGDPDGLVDGELCGLAPLRAPSLRRSTCSVTGSGRTVGDLGLGLLLHSARLELRRSLLALEDRDLVALLLDELGLPALLFKHTLDPRQEHLAHLPTPRFIKHRQSIRVSHARQMGRSGATVRPDADFVPVARWFRCHSFLRSYQKTI
jgi:hypothetical protein